MANFKFQKTIGYLCGKYTLMHGIEPHFRWRDQYIAAEDSRSPFYGRSYSEFEYSTKVYNYFIHPQWDEFGSSTLYLKVIFVDYDKSFAIIELIGEWNDCLYNDVMWLKREVADALTTEGVYKFMLIVENVYNFHGSEEDYYEEWWDDIKDDRGWVCILNAENHLVQEMEVSGLQHYVNFGAHFFIEKWRVLKPEMLLVATETLLENKTKELRY